MAIRVALSGFVGEDASNLVQWFLVSVLPYLLGISNCRGKTVLSPVPHTGLGLKEGLLNVSGDSILLFVFLEGGLPSESSLVPSVELMGGGSRKITASRPCVESFHA